MTRDDVIRIAREAGFMHMRNMTAGHDVIQPIAPYNCSIELEKFAALVAAAEREECAKVCDEQGVEWDSDAVVTEKNYAAHCAAVIRARGGT